MQRILLCATLFISIANIGSVRADEPEAAAESFIAKVQANKSSEAVDELYATNPWMKQKADAITNIRDRLVSITKLIGTLKNHEKLQDITVGTRFRYMSYMAAYERQPVRYVFEFYKPEGTWMLFGFSLDDKLDNDVEANAKAMLGRK